MASYKYLDNGKVQITITHGTKFDGTPRRFYKTVENISKKQLEVEAALFLADVIKGTATMGTSSTIDMLFSDFMDNHCSELKQSTVGRYRNFYTNQIAPYFANKKINKLTRNEIRAWVKHLASSGRIDTGEPLKPKTIKNALSLLSTMYQYAIYDLELLEKNPCTKIRIPKSNKRTDKKELYTEAECVELIQLLLDEKDDPRSKTHITLIFVILFTGLRTGEVMGLKWEDIDLKNNTIDIYNERVYIPNVGVVTDTPKTEESVRIISIPTFIRSMLIELKDLQGDNKSKLQEEYADSGYVAVTASGTPQYPRNTYNWFKRFLKRHNLKDTTIHDLRHTHAAMLSGLGVKIIDVSKRLGHTNTRITQEVYEYLFMDTDTTIADELDGYFNRLNKK
ncbi:MAG: site-specific integrase [Firmicutes bacterium]|nr:site-specific integrase [Bacillota bacterium]